MDSPPVLRGKKISSDELCEKINANLASYRKLLSDFLPRVDENLDGNSPPPAKKSNRVETEKLKILFFNDYSQVAEFIHGNGAERRDVLSKHLAEKSREGVHFAVAAFQLLQDRMRGGSSKSSAIGYWIEELISKEEKNAEEIVSAADLEKTCLAIIENLLRLYFDFDTSNATNFVSTAAAKLNRGVDFTSDLSIPETGILLLNFAMEKELAAIANVTKEPTDFLDSDHQKCRKYLFAPFSRYMFVPVYYRNGDEETFTGPLDIKSDEEVDQVIDENRHLRLIALPEHDKEFFKRMAISCVISNCVRNSFFEKLPCQLVLDDETRQIYAQFQIFRGDSPTYYGATNIVAYRGKYEKVMAYVTECIGLYARMLLYVNPNLSVEENPAMDLLSACGRELFAVLPLPRRKYAVDEANAISRINIVTLKFILHNQIYPLFQSTIDTFRGGAYDVERFINDEELVKSGARLVSLILDADVVSSSDNNFILYNGRRDEARKFLRDCFASKHHKNSLRIRGFNKT